MASCCLCPHGELALNISINNERKTAKAMGVTALERLFLLEASKGSSPGVAMATVNREQRGPWTR